MTNYNERLTAELVKLQGRAIKDWESDLAKAKQAITSLIKELVKEAKPEVPEEYERDDALSIGFTSGTEYYYDAISNLLKALEEV